MLRGQFTDLFESRLAFMDFILYENYDAPSLTYPMAFNVKDSDRAYEEMTGITGFGSFSKKAEGEKIEYDSLLQGYDKRFTPDTWAKGCQISFEAMEDDIDGAITNAAPALARAARNSIETEIFSVYNNAFGTTLTPDGQALCAAAHELRGGGTFNNLLTGDISQGKIEDALNIYHDMRGERNELINLEGTTILAHPDQKWIIHEILKSQLRSDTADNATNALNQVGLKTVFTKYFTDKNAWFLTCDPSQHNVIVYWRREPFVDSTLDFDTRNMKTAMLYRLSHGAADWRGIVGSQGS